MGDTEAVTTSEREQLKLLAADPVVEDTIASLAEKIVDEAVHTITPKDSPLHKVVNYVRPRHILDVLELYEYGRSFLRSPQWKRWRESFALGTSADGLYCGRKQNGDIGMLAVFWRTHNPVVDINLSLPEPSRDGSFVYVCWLWNKFGDDGVQSLRDHIERTQAGARFVAHHDQRGKSRGRGKIVTVPLGNVAEDEAVDRILAERNGHGR